MYKAAIYLLLPLMWVNITTGENRWELLGLGIGQLIYWIIIGLASYVASRSRYQLLVTALLLFAIVLRAFELIYDSELIYGLRVAATSGIFIVAGAIVYGRNPFFLQRQFIVFLALCIPIMLLQVLGVSSLL